MFKSIALEIVKWKWTLLNLSPIHTHTLSLYLSSTHPHAHKSTKAETEKMWCCYDIIVLSKQPADCCVRLVILLAAGLGESLLRENKDSIHIRLTPINGLGIMPAHTHVHSISHHCARLHTCAQKTCRFLLFMQGNLSQSSFLIKQLQRRWQICWNVTITEHLQLILLISFAWEQRRSRHRRRKLTSS